MPTAMPSVSSPLNDSHTAFSLCTPTTLDPSPTSEPIRKYAHQGEPRSIAFSWDGKLLVVGTVAGSIHIWDVATEKAAHAPLEAKDMDAVFAVAISPDGKHVAGGGSDNIIRIWNISESEDGAEPLRCESRHTDWIQSIEFSPDGKRLASASLDQTARFWDAETGREACAALKGHSSHVFKALFTPLGNQLVTGSADGTLKVWGATSPGSAPRCLRSVQVAPSNCCLALSPSGSTVATSNSDGSVIELRSLNSKRVTELGQGRISGVNCLSFSPSGMFLASGSADGLLHVWDKDTKAMATDPYKHPSGVQAVAFSPDGRWVASACRDGYVYLWYIGDIIMDISDQLTNGVETSSTASTNVHDDPRTTSLVLSLRRNFPWLERDLMMDSPTTEVSDLTFWLPILCLTYHFVFPIILECFSPSQLMFDQRCPYLLSGEPSCQQSIMSESGAEYALGGIPTPFIDRRPRTRRSEFYSDLLTRLQPSASSREPDQTLPHMERPRALAYSSNGKHLVVGTEGAVVQIWDLESGSVEQTLEDASGGMGAVFAVAISRDGKRVASGGADNTVRVWDVEGGGKPIACSGHRDWIQTLDFSDAPDGPLLASGSLDQTARLWRASTGQPAEDSVWAHKGDVFKVAFTPDYNKLVAGSGDGTLSVWDVWSNCDEPHRVRINPSNRCLALSPDGRTIATSNGEGSIIELRNLKGRLVRRAVRDSALNISNLCFSPDGNFLASGSNDGFVTVWDIQDGVPAAQPFKNGTLPIQAIAFSPDGQRLASACGNGEVCIWDVSDIVPWRTLEGTVTVVYSHSQTTVAEADDDKSTHSGSHQESRSLLSAPSPTAVSERQPSDSTNVDRRRNSGEESFMDVGVSTYLISV
ncbi:WD40 repeat-like protein [Coniophora puteana RWD-64-598 SS2]|uniref:WD40 repeat-like protein n=1 Tax=Coniophora puteana (strain RWD-64-598) TaxID=741705 RepID=A0A5M3MPL4_CONPW|nr:WD40 repeat-like protein [Coniophora puteana RWD-64-598 SS2]EIW81132.1 WD40 repeat-like protein [Coniophora puteana RWD-64-598 SS2]